MSLSKGRCHAARNACAVCECGKWQWEHIEPVRMTGLTGQIYQASQTGLVPTPNSRHKSNERKDPLQPAQVSKGLPANDARF